MVSEKLVIAKSREKVGRAGEVVVYVLLGKCISSSY